MTIGALDTLPGFRRRMLVTPLPGRVMAAVEDDYHCMAVTLHHDSATVTAIDPVMHRAPWTTCPGATAVLQATFTGMALADVSARVAKQANCTHLHDLTVLAAAHAGDSAPILYEMLVNDAIDGLVAAEIYRDGVLLHHIEHRDDIVSYPPEIAGISLFKLRGWIDGQSEPSREAARLLQWGAIIAHGRAISLDRQSDATRMPANCYTFQPEMKVRARRVGEIIDFSRNGPEPLDHLDGADFIARA